MNKIENIQETSKSYLSFQIGEELFATHVAHVNNIIEVPKITDVPNTPDYFKGVLNLRGAVLPVIDTRVKLNMPPAEFTQLTCVLVLEINHNNTIIQVGALVDQVQEVLEIEKENIKKPPEVKGMQKAREFIYGVVNHKEQFIMLVDIDRIFDTDYVGNISKQVESIKKKL